MAKISVPVMEPVPPEGTGKVKFAVTVLPAVKSVSFILMMVAVNGVPKVRLRVKGLARTLVIVSWFVASVSVIVYVRLSELGPSG